MISTILAKTLFTSGKGTYDGIKDDENLTNLYFNKFNDRTKMILNELKKAMTYIGFDELEIKRREDNILKCFNKNISLAKYIEDFVRKNNTQKDK